MQNQRLILRDRVALRFRKFGQSLGGSSTRALMQCNVQGAVNAAVAETRTVQR
jgi:hypothetical protein